MVLQEQGRLLIDQDLSDYIPEFDGTTVAVKIEEGGFETVPANRNITVRDLLTHTAGIGYGWGPGAERWEEAGIQGWYFADRDEPIAETVERMGNLPMDAQPGEKFVYGYATDILGVVIERASGMPLDEFLRVEILEPLGMVDTHFYVPPEKSDRLTVVYSVTEMNGMERAPDPGHMVGQGMYLEGPRKSFSGGAGLVSTPGDYARFLEALRRGGTLDGARILSPKTVQLMTVDHAHDAWQGDGGGFGLGFGITEEIGWNGLPGSPGTYAWGRSLSLHVLGRSRRRTGSFVYDAGYPCPGSRRPSASPGPHLPGAGGLKPDEKNADGRPDCRPPPSPMPSGRNP